MGQGKKWSRAGVPNRRPAGQIRPARPLEMARGPSNALQLNPARDTNFAYARLMMAFFGSTYCCEQLFSKMKLAKSRLAKIEFDWWSPHRYFESILHLLCQLISPRPRLSQTRTDITCLIDNFYWDDNEYSCNKCIIQCSLYEVTNSIECIS